MIGTDTDKKHTALAVLVYELRQDIDLYRLIGLNAKQLKEKGVSKNLLGHIQSLAHRSIAVCVCKIFEDSNRYELNSIPRIIESLPTGKPNKRQEQKLSEFAMRYKNSSMVNETQAYLRDTLDTFKGMNSKALDRLRRYRDKVAAHSESNVKIPSLPSLDEFENLYNFAKDFYEVVAETIIGVCPARIEKRVENGFVRLMRSLGIEGPFRDFPDEESCQA